MKFHGRTGSTSGYDDVVYSSFCARRCIVSPLSSKFVCWQLLGGAFICLDLFLAPLQVFDLNYITLLNVLDIVIMIYWIFDLVCQFTTATELRDGDLETRPSVIARNYVKTWFVLDAVILVVDFVCLFIGLGTATSKGWKLTKTKRAFRVLKTIKAMRVIKIVKLSQKLFDMARSEVVVVATKMFCNALLVITSCHYLGCYWYGIGALEKDSWLKSHSIENKGLWTQYIYSLHWALAQSGLASTGIVPTNELEYLYACCATLLWLMQMPAIVSIFTFNLVRLRDADRQQKRQEALLRKYLWVNGVSSTLTTRTLRFYRAHCQTRLCRVHEKDLEFFNELPTHLQVCLHGALYEPVLRTHPIFASMGNLKTQIAHIAVSERHCCAKDCLFVQDIGLVHMLFVVDGRLQYILRGQCLSLGPRAQNLIAGTWIGEPALWFKNWLTRGQLHCGSSSELIVLDIEQFHCIFAHSLAKERGQTIDLFVNYANNILEDLQEAHRLSDVISRAAIFNYLQRRSPSDLTSTSYKTISFKDLSGNVCSSISGYLQGWR